MTETLTVRMPAKLMRELKAKAKFARANAAEIFRQAATEYVRTYTGVNASQQHILAGQALGMGAFPASNCCGGRGHDSGRHFRAGGLVG